MDEIDDFFGNDEFDREPSPMGEEAIEDNTGEDGGKRVVAPKLLKLKKTTNRLALNEKMLTGQKGIPALRETFKDFKPNPKHDPYTNLDKLMKKYAHWGHLMFPKMKTEDVLSRVEVLGTRRQVKVYLAKQRLGMADEADEETEARKLSSGNAIIDDGADDDEPMGGSVDADDDPNEEDQHSTSPSFKKKLSSPAKVMEENAMNHDEDEEYRMMEEERLREEREAQAADAEDELLADFDLNNDW